MNVARRAVILSHAVLVGAYLLVAGLAVYFDVTSVAFYLTTEPPPEPPRYLELFLYVFVIGFVGVLVFLAVATTVGVRRWIRGDASVLRAIDGGVAFFVLGFPLLSLVQAVLDGTGVSNDALPGILLWGGLPGWCAALAFAIHPPARRAMEPSSSFGDAPPGGDAKTLVT